MVYFYYKGEGMNNKGSWDPKSQNKPSGMDEKKCDCAYPKAPGKSCQKCGCGDKNENYKNNNNGKCGGGSCGK